MSIVTLTAERTDGQAAREAAAGIEASLARDAETDASNAKERAARCAGRGDKAMAQAWADLAREAAGLAWGHFHRVVELASGSHEAAAARASANRADSHARQAAAIAARD